MEFKKPKPKKSSTPKEELLYPSTNEKEIVGVFNGENVSVLDWDSMNYLYESGTFGKGTLSKGQPTYHLTKDGICEIILQYQLENHLKWSANWNSFLSQQHLVSSGRKDLRLSIQSVSHFLESSFINENIDKKEAWKSWKKKHKQELERFNSRDFWAVGGDLTDVTNCTDETFSNLVNKILHSKQIKKPIDKTFKSKEVVVLFTSFNPQLSDISLASTTFALKELPLIFQEKLNLSLEESFFLKSVKNCLKVIDLNLSEIETEDLWEKFNSVDKNFTQRYITYNYYRSKGWVVKSGLKFGGDYLLYKDGPVCYHASYLVKVLEGRKKLTWRKFIAVNRLVETFNKDLLLCNVIANRTAMGKNVFTNHSVEEVLVRRWFPSKERFTP